MKICKKNVRIASTLFVLNEIAVCFVETLKCMGFVIWEMENLR